MNSYLKLSFLLICIFSLFSNGQLYSQKWKLVISPGLEIRPRVFNFSYEEYNYSPHPIPILDANRSLTGLSFSSLLGVKNSRHHFEGGIKYSVKYDFVYYDQVLPDTNVWSFTFGKPINLWLYDIALYIKKYFEVSGYLLGFEIGIGELNNNSQFTFARYIERLSTGEEVFYIENYNIICTDIQLGICFSSKQISSSFTLYYIGENGHNFLDRGAMIIPSFSLYYDLGGLISKSGK